MLAYLLAGVLGGLCSSAPIGPANLWVAEATLAGRTACVRAFLAGVIATDIVFAAVAAWGYRAWIAGADLGAGMGAAGGALLVVVGTALVARTPAVSHDSDRQVAGQARSFALGTVLVGSNPAFLAFWVMAIGAVEGAFGPPDDALPLVAFVLGVGLGDIAWFSVLQRILRAGRGLLRGRSLRGLRAVVGLVFVLVGMVALARSAPGLVV